MDPVEVAQLVRYGRFHGITSSPLPKVDSLARANHRDRFVAIEPESANYFWGDSFDVLANAAEPKLLGFSNSPDPNQSRNPHVFL